MSRRRPRVPGTFRSDLRGLDGGDRLRVALDSVREQSDRELDLVVVNNGARGPNVLDARGAKDRWVAEGILPGGVIAAVADLDDPSPATLLDNGFDVVHLLHLRGGGDHGNRILFEVFFHERLGLEPVAPFWVRWTPQGFVRDDGGGAA